MLLHLIEEDRQIILSDQLWLSEVQTKIDIDFFSYDNILEFSQVIHNGTNVIVSSLLQISSLYLPTYIYNHSK